VKNSTEAGMHKEKIMNYPKVDIGKLYPEMSLYLNETGFAFDVENQPNVHEFAKKLDTTFIKVAEGGLNIQENFSSSQRAFIDGESFEGKLVDYIPIDSMWKDSSGEYVYFLCYDDKIVKIGMTSDTLSGRYASYNCGTRKAMKKGSCSTTNYVITECNYSALLNNKNVSIYAIRLEKEFKTIEKFGVVKQIPVSICRGYEEIITDIFVSTYGVKPALCVQKGNSSI
jgi:hypothetical protein